MSSFKLRNYSAYDPQQMFTIAADIESYPQFIKLIEAARTSGRKVDEQGCESFRGELDIAYDKLNIRQTFASQVTLDGMALTIHSVSDEKPMKHLDSHWTFQPAPQGGTVIDYDVEYELTSKILKLVMAKSFDFAMQKVVQAFERRARQLYGAPGGRPLRSTG